LGILIVEGTKYTPRYTIFTIQHYEIPRGVASMAAKKKIMQRTKALKVAN